jgi:chorismate mutase
MRTLFFILIVISSFQVKANTTAEQLFKTINERLSYMEDVALFKALNHKPVEDIHREEIVLVKAKESAGQYGLDAEQVEGFFQAQIAVAKAIQYRHRADWLAQPINRQPRDLQTVIRPALLTLGNQINTQIAEYIKQNGPLTSEQFGTLDKAINVKYVNEADKKLLFNALMGIKAIQ